MPAELYVRGWNFMEKRYQVFTLAEWLNLVYCSGERINHQWENHGIYDSEEEAGETK